MHEHSVSQMSSKGANRESLNIPLIVQTKGMAGSLLVEKRSLLRQFFEDARNVFKVDELGWEIAVIALPALLALACDPLASLVDTAFIGQIGSVELGAVGVSIAVFNLVSKLLNLPVLNITTSFVAEEDATEAAYSKEQELQVDSSEPFIDGDGYPLLSNRDSENLTVDGNGKEIYKKHVTEQRNLPAVSTALVVGAVLGLVEACVLAWGAGPILDIMGVPADSNMRLPAKQYLALRAIGAPAVVVSLAVQGVFRGFKDTKTPLYATVSGNIVNIVLDPILMFSLGYGVSGAAVATIISQYLIVLMLLWKLNKIVMLMPPRLGDLQFDRFLKNGSARHITKEKKRDRRRHHACDILPSRKKRRSKRRGGPVRSCQSKKRDLPSGESPPKNTATTFSLTQPHPPTGGLLLARSTAVMLSMTLATSEVARQGAIQMAAHQICMQIWLATSLLSDSIALAGQAIIATALAKGDLRRTKDAAFRILQMGFAFGFILSLILGVSLNPFSKVFTNDSRVLEFMTLGTPFVAATQPINSLAFVFDGIHFGASDFEYAAYSMIVVALLASIFMLGAAPTWGFVGVWVGLTILMSLRMFAGIFRIGTATGPWKFLK